MPFRELVQADLELRKLREEYGIGVVMIGVRRLALPKTVSETVIDTMKEERKSKAAEYTSSGESRATAIRERARAASEKILAFARRKAEGIRREGDQAAAAYYEKFTGHEDLAVFLRSLEALRIELASRAVILLSESSQPMLQWFRSPPTAESLHKMTTSQPAGGAGPKTAEPEK